MSGDTDVVVVGAGVAGLVAASDLVRAGLRVRVLESGDEPGGRARTTTWAGCRVEQGAMYFTPRYRELMRAAEEAGVRRRTVPLPNAFRAAIRRRDRWHHVNYQQPLSVALYGGIGLVDKATLGGVLATTVPQRPGMRFGDLASAAALDGRPIPTTRDAHGYFTSLVIEIFCGYRPDDITLPVVALAAWFPGRALSFEGGIGTLPRAMAERLPVEYGAEAADVAVEDGGVAVALRGGAPAVRARAVVLATPADVTAQLWPDAPEYVRGVRYTDMALVFMRTKRPFQPTTPRGRRLYMQVVPQSETSGALQAIDFLNEEAPDGGLLMAAAMPEARAALDDEELATAVREEAEALNPELRGLVEDVAVGRRPRVVASFASGGSARAAAFRSERAPGPIQVAGDYTHGVWMESAAQSGRHAAELVQQHLRASPS